MLHVVYRVGDMDKTIKFYQDAFGMQLLRQRDIPEGKYSNAFLGYGTESEGKYFSIELTYNYGVTSYKMGNAFQGMGLSLPDLRSVSKKVGGAGGAVVSGPEDVEYGPCIIPDEEVGKKTIATVMKVTDPDGYAFEVTERARRDPVSKVCLHVSNLEAAVEFYEKALGMTMFYRRSNVPYDPSIVVGLGYGAADDTTILELRYEYGNDKLDMGEAYGQIAVGTPDVYKAADSITSAGYEIARAPGPVPGIGTKIVAVRDPDGYKIVLVDQEDLEKELQEG
ncbi:Glyoxalase/Bleomycin resistance protein/Dihydroxybiphenyl dioxygenase [Tribonema minus]|uniref:Glyoxalase/Bleomycin resistance protein/Dihydroxybiphenyl dioxygenase n=1 Tax=Tribonema minus TaxID=303371 RepID=A0A836C8T2_9STRA|nr:Glyoxalase/Bleomycin resistance protein/Dihydroxybiphenyl dioxygenase [Tribonema minus]